jgi:hypothetical protein
MCVCGSLIYVTDIFHFQLLLRRKWICEMHTCWSQWPHGLRRRSTATRQLRSWVQIPPEACMSVCCVLSGRGLCDELIAHPEESYRLSIVVCDLETS